jgi:hypothetical protein
VEEYPNEGVYDNPADARLIALAPEMADYIRRVRAGLVLARDAIVSPDFYNKTLVEADALLARARGEDAS